LIGLPQGVYLPGGGVYPNETLINGLKREILEETGYTSTVGEKIGVAAQYRNDSSTGIPYKKVGHYYFVNLRIQIQDAIEKDHQLIWRDANSASLILKREAQRWGLQAGLRMQKKPKLIGKISGRAFIDFTRGKLLGN
jgi:8-oxo-dGTP diphosphatase